MPEKNADVRIARQTELAVCRLDSLCTLPCVAARFFRRPPQSQSIPSTLAEIIESDAALGARIFSLAHEQGVRPADERASIREALGKLPAQMVRDAVFSVEVCAGGDAESESQQVVSDKELALHSLAVACCAEELAEAAAGEIDSRLAYSAGLLHDIGKLALKQSMPKSFARIAAEAKSENVCSCAIEQKYLGVDHAILGKRLAQKWHLPNPIMLSVWLHHSDTVTICEAMPEARIAQIVQLADCIARQCGIGQSGSYDSGDFSERIALSLSVRREQLDRIVQNLAVKVARRSEILGLDLANAQAAYRNAVHSTAANLAREQTELLLENRRLQVTSSHFDFATDFLLSVNSAAEAIDAAKSFAVRWQKFYQTGKVCVYLTNNSAPEFVEAVVVEKLSQSRIVYLDVPADTAEVPKAIQSSFAILNAHECAAWLFEKLDVDFDTEQTKLVPLLSNGKAIGAIAFEVRYPGDSALFEERFRMSTSIAGAVLDMAFSRRDQRDFAERFVGLVGRTKAAERGPVSDELLEALGEMAGGAAHELNNPLSVISGRAQILSDGETDAEKKQMSEQIQENSREISEIINDLMVFARPQRPRPAETNVEQLLDEAMHLAAQRANVDEVDVRIEVSEGGDNVFVDSAQIVSAIANIFSNALESYGEGLGPIEVAAVSDEPGEFVRFEIRDSGCGMDAETVRKATQPFFSAKPAGRKRGMGLAHAHRLIELNNGSMSITSRPGSGTTVTVVLPCKSL